MRGHWPSGHGAEPEAGMGCQRWGCAARGAALRVGLCVGLQVWLDIVARTMGTDGCLDMPVKPRDSKWQHCVRVRSVYPCSVAG